MTVPNQFEQEKAHVENLLSHLGISYHLLVKGEDPPDILVVAKDRSIAVEVTEYHQTQDMRNRESAWEDIGKRIAHKRKSSHVVLDKLHFYLRFKEGPLPSKGKRDLFVTALLELARDESKSAQSKKRSKTFESGILSRYLNSIDIEPSPNYWRWNSNVEGGSVGLRECELLRAVKSKKDKQPTSGLGREKTWLLIAGGFRTSQFMGIFDVHDLGEYGLLQRELEENHFGEVYLLPYFENLLFKWTFNNGWESVQNDNPH
jgi:hypothetical protein